MAANSSINLVGLDFDSIKTNLKNHLKTNTAFKDYNFEGSNMAVLVDLLSYNTYLNSFYLNMVASEMFLDTAQLKDSIVSHAKELNYLPRSYTSAVATVNITITPSTIVSSILIPKGTSFSSRVGSSTYSFTTNQNIVVNNPDEDGNYVANNVSLYEGSYVSDSFVESATSTSRFVLSNPSIDISSLTVTVIENGGAEVYNYLRAQSLFDVDSSSKVFFIQPAENSQYEIVFGNDVFGRKPKNGAVVVAEYRICNGEMPNGASVFVNDGPIDGNNIVEVQTVSTATNGSVGETADSIRFNAPRAVATQERAVTASDYKSLLQIQFPEIQAINVYGGEDLNPPQYGKVFISVDIYGADGIPESNKNIYYNYIKTKTPLTITPEFIAPEFTYIDVNSTVRYNVNVTQKQLSEISTLVQAAINDYSDNRLNDFESTLRYSQLVKAIDSADSSIVGNETSIRAIKILSTPTLKIGSAQNYTIYFDLELSDEYYVTGTTFNASATHTVQSSLFSYNNLLCRIVDNAGVLNIVKEQNDGIYIVVAPIGSVDYTTGTLTIVNFKPSNVPGGKIKFYAIPMIKDITCHKNVILKVLEEDININVERVRE